MNKQELEQKTGVTVLAIPNVYEEDDDTKVNVTLPCGHTKLIQIKTLIKKTPKCLTCNPPKPRKKKDEVENSLITGIITDELKGSSRAFLDALLEKLVDDDVIKLAKLFNTVRRESNMKEL